MFQKILRERRQKFILYPYVSDTLAETFLSDTAHTVNAKHPFPEVLGWLEKLLTIFAS